ncbi:uncharacterized protein JCM6883_005073 [Sporobolomyces salmoneus]|uniref:uncharacterized protein n=1 Tax=Sporobolomyces salmoneus TaxID=183962 RepID=UPI00317DD515
MSASVTINRNRSPSRQGRAGTISPTNSYDPAFAPSRSSPSISPRSPALCLSSTPPEDDRFVCAEEVGKRLRELSKSSKPGLEILHLPPLLSLLPPSLKPASTPTSSSSLANYTDSSLPSITPLSISLHRALHSLRPLTPLYAISPYSESFNWSELELKGLTEQELVREREWYIVAFRSKRREGFTEEEREALYAADREAHEEATQAGGLLCYWFGAPLSSVDSSSSDLAGRNLATCIWESRASALLAMRGEKHKIAAQLASRSYESYTLERYLLRKEPGSKRIEVKEWQGRDVLGIGY